MTRAEYRRRRKEMIEVASTMFSGHAVSGSERVVWAVRSACSLIDKCDKVMEEIDAHQRRERASSAEVGEG